MQLTATSAAGLLLSVLTTLSLAGQLSRRHRLRSKIKDELDILTRMPDTPARARIDALVERHAMRLARLEDPELRTPLLEILGTAYLLLYGTWVLASPHSPTLQRALALAGLAVGALNTILELRRRHTARTKWTTAADQAH